MKKFKVTIITTFEKEVEVEAANAEEAQAIVEKQVSDGDVDGTDTLDFDTKVIVDEDELISEDEIGRPSFIDDYDEMEDFVRDYLETEYGHKVVSFTLEYDMRNVYITNIEWGEELC